MGTSQSLGSFSDRHLRRTAKTLKEASLIASRVQQSLGRLDLSLSRGQLRQLTWMIRSEMDLALSFEMMRFGKPPLDRHQIGDLVQDILLHFDDIHSDTWN